MAGVSKCCYIASSSRRLVEVWQYLRKLLLCMHLFEGIQKRSGMELLCGEGNKTWCSMINKVDEYVVMLSTTREEMVGCAT
mgnify:CR=1 FL=1